MAEDWTPEEVAATVADYFDMLLHELRGEPYNKAEHNRRLRERLRDRSRGSVEFKHGNISAILLEEGFPFIDGYKQRVNYQDRLRVEVLEQLALNRPLIDAAAAAVGITEVARPTLDSVAGVLVPRPAPTLRPRYVRDAPTPVLPRLGINYLEREAKNTALGTAGELFVLEFEHRRLWEAGRRDLANRIEHVAKTKGDGLGFDILSYETDGREQLIEVKTTSFGQRTPFFASQREVVVSDQRSEAFRLYRVFRFRSDPKVFVLPGSLQESCDLEPTQFRASIV
jgi:hypothetical protein